MLTNSRILITGGTGSFGKTFIPMTLGKYNPKEIIIYSRDEMKQWTLAENFKNDACTHPLTREQYRILINMGFTDLVKYFVKGKTNWTFWGYRGGGWQKGNGLRIDHFLTSSQITDIIKTVKIDRNPRGWEKASDHTPVTLEIES